MPNRPTASPTPRFAFTRARWLPVVLFAFPALLAARSAPGESVTWTIPGIANVPGQNGTRFVSDVAVTNAGSVPAAATVSFVPSGSYPAVPVDLAPGQTVVWRNVLQQLWGASASGALQVASSGASLLIRARTYNDAASGTYGVALPVYDANGFLSPGDVGHSLWVSQSPDPKAGYRTNIAVLFPDSGGGAATVTVYDGDRNEIGQSDFSLTAAGVQQISVGKFASPASVARATIAVLSGHATGYSAVVDNVTGDSSLFTFDPLPAGRQDALINGVARANGKNGTFFRTDGRFYNPGDQDAAVTAAFHASGASNTSPVTGTFTVPAGKILDVTDVLGTLLGEPVGSSGAVRFTADSPVGILCRTSNVDPTGAKPGTFGAQQKPVPLLSLLSSADAGALMTGVRQSAAFRTNIAVAAGGDGATAQFTLKTTEGVTAATTTQTLGPYGWQQTAVDKLFAGTSIPDDAEVLVKITQGSADVFDSSVDNASGDSVVTPAPALPVAIPSSATIGAEGGSIQSSDGRLTLLIPAGALSSPTGISLATDASDALNGVGPAYVLSPTGLNFAKPLIARLAYGPDDVAGSGAAGLAIAFRQTDGWYTVTGGLVDTGRRTVSVVLPAGAPSPAAGRAALDILSWSQRIAMLQALQIVPKGASLIGGQQTDFKAYYSGPPSSAKCLKPFCAEKAVSPYAVNVVWYVDGDRGGNATVGTVAPETGTTTTYTAPCAHPVPVEVSFKISDPRIPGAAEVRAEQMAKVNVFSRGKWQVTIEQRNSEACPSGGEVFGWTSSVVLEFSIKDGGGAVTGLTKVGGSNTMQLTNTCVDRLDCTLTPNHDWPGLTIDAVTATFGQNGVAFHIDMTEMAAGLETAVACPNSSVYTLALVPGPQFSFGPDILGPAGGERRIQVPGDNRAYVRYSLQPLPNCGN